jgi:hypothetical protein
VASKLDGTIDVTQVFSTGYAFAALRADGSVVTWGWTDWGGDSSAVASGARWHDRRDAGVFELRSLCRAARRWLGGDLGGCRSGRRQQRRGAALDGTIDVTQVFSSSERLCRAARRWLGGDLG